jgi:hypothetical protein
VLFLLVLAASQALAQPEEKRGALTDPQDGAFDTSEWLLDRKGFLPVPIIVTEPAVGYGGGLALLFFRESIREAAARSREGGHVTPPDIYGAAYAATENGTNFGGAGGMVTFDNDRWRWRGAIAHADANLDFYGMGGNLGTGEFNVGYNLQGWLSTQQVLRRLGASDNFVAARWIWLDLESAFDSDPPLPGHSRAVRSSGLGLSFEHDSRDNFFTPSTGWKGGIESMFYSPEIGSDNRYQIYRGFAFGYAPLGRQFILGGRLDARTARGDVPFYQLPYIDLRGIPVVRYQDENAGVAEAELRWNATPRWALIGFFGSGRAWGTGASFSGADNVNAKGAGFRYLIAWRLGLYVGVDIARGPEDTAFYIQVGSAWR